MKKNDQDLIVQMIIKENFIRQATFSVEDAVMRKVEEKKITRKHRTPNRNIYDFLLILSIVFECCLIFLPLNFKTLFYLEKGSSELYIIQSSAILAIVLQIDTLLQNRKHISSKEAI